MTSRRLSVEQEGRALVERLGGRWATSGAMCRCPAHDDRTPSLSIRPGRTRLLLHCFAGCSASDVLRALEADGLLEPVSPAAEDPDRGRCDKDRSAAARRIWSEARSIDGTAAAAYLAARKISAQSPELRFHPATPLGPKPLALFRPALIAAVRDDCGLVGIQRTFLDSGRPGVPAERCALGRSGNGAVRLGGLSRRIGLAEGLETALSATALFGVPCWATLGTERFRLISLPPEVEELLLFLDQDAGGRRAEALARQAFAHLRRIETHYPQRSGEDWNDVLRRSHA